MQPTSPDWYVVTPMFSSPPVMTTNVMHKIMHHVTHVTGLHTYPVICCSIQCCIGRCGIFWSLIV